MTVKKRFNGTFKGSVIMFGNSLGLATGGTNYTAIDRFTVASVEPPGGTTTTTYTSDSSAVIVKIPSDSIVRYAELVWSGSAQIPASSVTYNNSVTLKDPAGTDHTINRDTTTTQTYNNGSGYIWYSQSVDITDIVKNGGSGKYTIGSVASVLTEGGLGFVILIAYENAAEEYKNINIWTSNEYLSTATNIDITGFATPSVGAVNAKLILAANGGQSGYTGESVKIGINASSLVTINGPNNPADNFFCSQINNNDGQLDTTGTFGNSNATPGSHPTAGVRFNYDCTRVDASAGFTNNQTSARLNLTTSSDVALINAIALQVDVNSADLPQGTKMVDKRYCDIGDELSYTLVFTNQGLSDAESTVYVNTIPNGLSFITNSLAINGVTTTSLIQPPGIALGTIVSKSVNTISYRVRVDTIPSPNPIVNVGTLVYRFTSAVGLPSQLGSNPVNMPQTKVNHVELTLDKKVNKGKVDFGENINYTISIKNIGSTTANNVFLHDTIPKEISFIDNSLNVSGITIPGTLSAGVNNINIGDVVAGGTATVTFSMNGDSLTTINNSAMATCTYYVDPSIPTPIYVSSNTSLATSAIRTATLLVVKDPTIAYGRIGSEIGYTVSFKNQGNINAESIVYVDTIPTGTSYVSNSLKLNEVQLTGITPNPGFTVNIGTIPAGKLATINYKVKVDTIPSTNPIPNTTTTAYRYTIDSVGPYLGRKSATTSTSTRVNEGILQLTTVTSKVSVDYQEEMNYTTTVQNKGSATVKDVIIKGLLNDEVNYVSSSFTFNGTGFPPPENIKDGLNIGSIAVGEIVTINFKGIIQN